MLMILDGWGHGKKDETNAIHLARTSFVDSLYKQYPNSELKTFGEHVGLPKGQMGNSEVGHLNIGAGRIVYQDFAKINKAIDDNEFASNPKLLEAFDYAKKNNKTVHFIGLVSDGGIHAHQNHLVSLCKAANDYGLNKAFIHAFTDGRDTAPTSGKSSIEFVKENINDTPVQLASVIGRYYAMDRDNRWERIKKAYDLLVNGVGIKTTDALKSIQDLYNQDITDEFMEALVCVDEQGNPIAKIQEHDVVICFNFRTDRCRQITIALTQEDLKRHGMNTLPLHYVTMTNYNKSFVNVNVLYEKDDLKMTLGEVVSNAGKSQVRIAETEKYPHVTFFFSGGREQPFKQDKRIVVNSPKVATYDLQPEMSANEVVDKINEEINHNQPDFVCLNFANPDMVGHTGDQLAIIKAIETIDASAQSVVETALAHNYGIVIIADHGNAELNINPDGSIHTAHTTNLVPCFALNTVKKNLNDGSLADVAPTILDIMDIKKPIEMTGDSLLFNND